MTSREVLVEAKKILLRDGWTQGTFGADGYPRCVRGAIYAVEGLPFDNDIWLEVETLLAEAAGVERWEKLVRWNDDPDRTEGEVLAAFDRAIELAS